MPNFTKRAIKEAFVALLDERPLNKITVKDVVEACGINRNSFYYHFQDLPALLEEIIAQRVQELIDKRNDITAGTEESEETQEAEEKTDEIIMDKDEEQKAEDEALLETE